MSPAARRNLGLLVGVGAIIALCVIFPRVLGFVERAARELSRTHSDNAVVAKRRTVWRR